MQSFGYLLGLELLPELFYLSRLWCLGVVACLWLGDNIKILSIVKPAHLNRLWAPHHLQVSLTTGR
jgi:hypothetical protein